MKRIDRVFQLGIALIVFLLFVGLPIIERASDRHYDHLEQPPSAIDAVMRSRETAAVTPNYGAAVFFLGFALVAIVAIIGGLYYMKLQTDLATQQANLLKQQRLANKPPPLQPAPLLTDAQQAQPLRRLSNDASHTRIN